MEQVIEFIRTNPYAHFVFLGFLIGLVVRILMPGPDPMGIIKTTLLGISGTLLSGFLIKTYGLSMPALNIGGGYVAPVLGAFLILSVFKVVRNIG